MTVTTEFSTYLDGKLIRFRPVSDTELKAGKYYWFSHAAIYEATGRFRQFLGRRVGKKICDLIEVPDGKS
jgi:hypothetical protein